jgi:dolichyl-phosphate beta-glucosyltransferase
VFPIPLLGLAAVRYGRQKTSMRVFVAQWAALLIVLISSSLELFLDATLLVTLVGLVGVVSRGALRPAFRSIARGVALGYAVCLPVLGLIAYVGLSAPHGPVQHSPSGFSTDLLNLVAPTPTLLTGSIAWVRRFSSHFVGNIGEQDGYLGIPLLVVAAAGLRLAWGRVWPAALVLLLGVALSLGPSSPPTDIRSLHSPSASRMPRYSGTRCPHATRCSCSCRRS